MANYYSKHIKKQIEKYKLPMSYPDDAFDVMKSDYYKKHYGESKNMDTFIP